MKHDASGAKSANGVESPSSTAMHEAAADGVPPHTDGARSTSGRGKRVPKTRRAEHRRPHRKTSAPTRAKRGKPDALRDTLGRPFPPAPAEIKSAGGKLVDKGGRPYAIKDVPHAISTLEGLGAIMATSKECAAVLRIDEKTLFNFFKKYPAAREAWHGGKEQGKASLRRSQFKLAERNATMGIFLGMQYLDQKDKRAFSGDPENPIRHQHAGTVTAKVRPEYSKLSTDELVRLHSEKAGTKGPD